MHWLDCAKHALVAGLALIAGAFGNDRFMASRRVFAFEPLEPRLPLSVAPGLVEVGAQPVGGLTGKIVYVHGGHGYTANNTTNGAWSFQRGEGFEMIEDLGNIDQTTYLADYLFRAGATIVPMRPIGHQTNEIVMDNDDPGVSFVGNWTNSTSGVFFGSAGDLPYKYASTSPTGTAYARYRPTVDEAGFYPVYAWTRSGSDRATDQLYSVNHSGGITEVKVNHRRVGNGLVYLGTYHFDVGTNGYVDISNRSGSAESIVVADMIRFGNGMGDIDRGGGVSGLAREDEAGLYWIMWHVDHSQGINSSSYRSTNVDRDATVAASPKYSTFMNRESDGALKDRLLLSYHSNAGGGRGVTVLHNTASGGTTPNQLLLAQTLGKEINDDLVAQTAQFEHTWNNRGSNITYEADFNYGELNNAYINNEFDATIIEVAFHDNELDAELMRDPNVRDAVARATYQGVIKYFRAVDGNTTSAVNAPATVTGVRAESNASGAVTISWNVPVANLYAGDAATSYRIYGSINGYGFDGGTFVPGGGITSFTFTGINPANGLNTNIPYFFKVVAVNAGGESPDSEVIAAIPAGGKKQILVVNGFDRLDRALNPTQPYGSAPNTVERVRVRGGNTRDYVTQVALAVESVAPGVSLNSTSNEAVISGTVNLTDYDTVIWILGEESTDDDTFNATEQTKVTQFINGGGNLFVTGAEIGWDLDAQNNGRTFYQNTLLGTYAADDANTYAVQGIAGGIFAGLNFSFDNGSQFYNSEYADVITPRPGAVAALSYAGGAGSAAITSVGTSGRGNLVMFGFPFETITTAANRAIVMDKVLKFFGVEAIANADFNQDLIVDAADYVIWRNNSNTAQSAGLNGDANRDGNVNATDYQIWRSQFGMTVAAASGAASIAVVEVVDMSNISQPLGKTLEESIDAVAASPQEAAFAWVATNHSELLGRRDRFFARPKQTASPADQGYEAMIAEMASRQVRQVKSVAVGERLLTVATEANDSESFLYGERTLKDDFLIDRALCKLVRESLTSGGDLP